MKAFSPQSLLTAITGGLFVLTIGPALAGNQSEHPSAPVPVRVTTGVEEVKGWEQGLVKGNPNLGHWHWDPIYSYKQGYGVLRQKPLKPGNGPFAGGQPGKPTKSTFNYPIDHHDVKPIHLPYSPQAMAEIQGRLSQPERQQSPENEPETKESVSGQLTNHPIKQPVISSYKHTYAQLANPETALKYSNQQTDVYGQLLNPHIQKQSSNQTAIKSNRTAKLDKIKRNHNRITILPNPKSRSIAKKGELGHSGKLENQKR